MPIKFAALQDQLLQHVEILKTHYEKKPNKEELKLMYIKAYPKAYHQNFITQGEKLKEMISNSIANYFQVLHREEEEVQPQSASRTESSSRKFSE